MQPIQQTTHSGGRRAPPPPPPPQPQPQTQQQQQQKKKKKKIIKKLNYITLWQLFQLKYNKSICFHEFHIF